jgi:hypothetical protein
MSLSLLSATRRAFDAQRMPKTVPPPSRCAPCAMRERTREREQATRADAILAARMPVFHFATMHAR